MTLSYLHHLLGTTLQAACRMGIGWAMVQGFPAQTQPWMDTSLPPAQRASLLVAQMTLDEKIAMVHGTGQQIPYVGNVTNNARLGIPALHLQDGPAGVGDGLQGVTAPPAPIALAATWDTSLARQYGTLIGGEARGKGIHVLLGPMINMVRVPQGGRSFETFGEDPYLSAAMAAADIQGIQSQGVIANAKHFVCNDQETDRGLESSDVDERTLQEIYFTPFRAAVRAGVGSICGSYNQVNGIYACMSPLLGAVLKVMWGFDGFVECDWGASFGDVQAANNGLDLEMAWGTRFGDPLKTDVQSGAVAMSQLDAMVRRIFTPMFRFGIFDNPTTGDAGAIVTTPAHAQFARDTAAQGIVLLKNTAGLLPLNPATVHSIAVLGSVGGVNPIWVGSGSGTVYLPYYDIPVDAIANRAGPGITVNYNQGDGGFIPQAVQLAQQADVAIVCVGQQTGEGTDRASLSLPGDQDALVNAVAAANPRTIVVMYVDAGTLMPWAGQVAAALVAWYPGQEGGHALASVLFGDVNPSGKLPVTFPAAADQVPANTPAQYPGVNYHVSYSERLQIGYRWYDANNVAPQFPFGHGLSYTTFLYSNLTVSPVSPSGQVAVGVDVQNTGTRAGAEVVQLYLGFPSGVGEPPRLLKGFRKVTLPPGASAHVTFTLVWEDLAYWDAIAHAWAVPTGTFVVMAGSSSRDIRRVGSLTVASPIPSCGLANQALFKLVTVSSALATNYPGAAAVDGNPTTRWASLAGDPQWLTVDLGAVKEIRRVRLYWDTNYARSYQIRLSNDNTNWTSGYSTTSGAGGLEDILVTSAAHYVQIYGTQSATGSGYSLQEVEVYSPEAQVFPKLSILPTGTNTFRVSWPVAWGGSELQQNTYLNWGAYGLQQNANLNTANWAPVPQTPTQVNGTNQLILPHPGTSQFYRLSSP